ncbi:type IV toxin-antitoxin system AbiEi family antitoxin domain-containing protein [Streptomyces sp. SID13031]|nr:type IV toxin-antitoxin system AbiEi family antitoxin domain-containing protein [Streptomyces sp. SID13031]NEA35968.1 type IV toxin-antitoxin system AbiEi family antitoxin domain-containing protein [Streptomyces sp. SID13031]
MTHIRGGVFTRADARACGYPDPDIDSLLDTGGWRRIRPGTYAPHQTLTLVDDQMLHLRRLFQVLRRGEPGLIASHQSAAALHALPLWGLDLTDLHLTTRTGTPGLQPSGIHRHVRDPVGPGVTVWNKLRLVTPARAVAEIAATSPLAPAVALTEAALYAGLATPADLRRAINNLAEAPARDGDPLGCGPARAQRVLELAGSGSASVAESRLHLILTEADLPAPSPSPPPLLEEHTLDPASTLWFPDQRTVVEFEPRFPFWSEEFDDYSPEASDRAFGAIGSTDAEPPEPLEYCWISWTDLDYPDLIADRLRTTFARATRRTGVHTLDPRRHRRRP